MEERKSLKDIANELGLSISTVHRALKGYGRISEETKASILKKAEESGYRVNLAASILSSSKGMKLCIIYPDTHFYNEIAQGARKAEKELSIYGVSVEHITTKKYCPIQQSEILNGIIGRTEEVSFEENQHVYDGIGIAPSHPLLLNPLLSRINSVGIKIVTFNNDAPDSKRSCFIGQNPYVAGKTAAQIYASALPKGSIVALMSSFVSALGLRKRIDGFLEEAENSGLKIVGPFEYNDSIDDACEMSKQVIKTNQVNALYSNSMYGSIGCARAIENTGNTGKVFMTGFDLDKEIAGFIEKGTMHATIHQSPFLQGYYTIKTLYERCLARRNQSAEEIGQQDIQYIKSYIIMKSNLEEFLREEYL